MVGVDVYCVSLLRKLVRKVWAFFEKKQTLWQRFRRLSKSNQNTDPFNGIIERSVTKIIFPHRAVSEDKFSLYLVLRIPAHLFQRGRQPLMVSLERFVALSWERIISWPHCHQPIDTSDCLDASWVSIYARERSQRFACMGPVLYLCLMDQIYV